MTNQTNFTPEIKAEAERLWLEAFTELNGFKPSALGMLSSISKLALCRLLVATGWKPPVDPIEAKAREIVADQVEQNGYKATAAYLRIGDSGPLKEYGPKIALAKAGILAGMEIGK